MIDNSLSLYHQIAQELGETESGPVNQIRLIGEALGEPVARELLDETRRIESEGGLWIEGANRRRTPGGVFLFLARERCTDEQLAEIFNERRQADGRYGRLPKPPTYAFGADWPGMTPEAYMRLCQAGIGPGLKRLDLLRALWEEKGEEGLITCAHQAREQMQESRDAKFSVLLPRLAYQSLSLEAQARLSPPEPPTPPAPKKSKPERRPPVKPVFKASGAETRFSMGRTEVARPRADYSARTSKAEIRSITPPPPPPPPPPTPEELTRNIDDPDLRAVAQQAGITKPLSQSQIEILGAARQALSLDRLAQLAAEAKADARAGGIEAQSGERLTTPELIFVYQLYARLNRAQRKRLTAPQGWATASAPDSA